MYTHLITILGSTKLFFKNLSFKNRKYFSVEEVTISDLQYVSKIATGNSARFYKFICRTKGQIVLKEILKTGKGFIRSNLEVHYLQKCRDTGLVPEFVHSFETSNRLYMLTKAVPGTTLENMSVYSYYSESMGRDHIRSVITGLKVLITHGVLLRNLDPKQILARETNPYFDISFLNLKSCISYHPGAYNDNFKIEKHPGDKQFDAEFGLPYLVGMLLYKLVVGTVPFRTEKDKEKIDIFWPREQKRYSDEMKGFIYSCLNRRQYRLKFSEILNHEFFKISVHSEQKSFLEAHSE